jgi:uncharacterized protein (TIRG00374 family)
VHSGKNWLRLVGLVLLALLFYRADPYQLVAIFVHASPLMLGIAIGLNIPQICIEAYRWRWLLRAQQTEYRMWPATLSYFGSIFIGLLTPGRFGEFVKVMHLNQDCNVPIGRALSSVLADRLFDFYALLIVGGAAVLSVTEGSIALIALTGLILLVTLPLGLFMNNIVFGYLQQISLRVGPVGRRLLAPGSWLLQLWIKPVSLSRSTIDNHLRPTGER